jgi:hypothetical protein
MRNKNLSGRFIILASIILGFSDFFLILSANAQHKKNAFDSTYHHKNNVKINLSPYLIYENPIVLSYERSVNKYQTFAITAGYLKFPSLGLLNIPNVNFKNEKSSSGYTFGGEYRFYLQKENKYMAPHGVYLGPYFSYFNFDNSRSATFIDSAGNQSDFSLSTSISLLNIGVELGYQFVIWDRLTIDLIMIAPSITSYLAEFNLTGSVNDAHKGQINEEVKQAILNHFPFLNKLVSDKSVSVSGVANSHNSVWAPGLKFSIFLGYRFGK